MLSWVKTLQTLPVTKTFVFYLRMWNQTLETSKDRFYLAVEKHYNVTCWMRYNHSFVRVPYRFDASTGTFTVNTAGLYFFLVNLHSDTSGNDDNLNIQRNDEIICHLLAKGTEDTEIPTTCGTIVELVPGDEVFVECVVDAFWITPGDFNNFAGFLINAYLQ